MPSTILKVFGGIFLLLLSVAFIFLVIFWKKIKGFFRKVLKDAELSSGAPQNLHLNEVDDRTWLEEKTAKDILSLLKTHGYHEGKVYEISEIGSALLLSLANPENGTAASIIYHDSVGTWFELAAETETLSIHYTNSEHQAFSTLPDWLESHYLPDKEPTEIIKAFEERIANEKIQTYSLEEFRDKYESSHRRFMKWKNESGGLTFEEVKIQNERMEESLSDSQLTEAYLAVKVSEFNAWAYAMWEELHTNPELKYPDEPTFIVPDRAVCEAFVEYIEDYFSFSENQLAEIKALSQGRMDCGVFFDEIMSRISENLRPKEHCKVEFPLNSRVFIVSDIEINQMEDIETSCAT